MVAALLLLAGCTAPAPTASGAALASASAGPASPATQTLSPCDVQPPAPAAPPMSAWMRTDMDGDARRLAQLTGDDLTQEALAQRTQPGVQSAQWATVKNGTVRYEAQRVGDTTVDGAYWPRATWTYASGRTWPEGTDAERNATLLALVQQASGLPAERIRAAVVPEGAEQETEFHMRQTFGGLAGIPIADAKVSWKTYRPGVSMSVYGAYTIAEAGVEPLQTLRDRAVGAAECWARQQGFANKSRLFVQPSHETHVMNASLVETFAFSLPDAVGKPGCWSPKILSVRMDAVTGAVREVARSSSAVDCLRQA